MKKSSKTNDENLSAFFIAVEQGEIGKFIRCVSSVNRDGFSALDVATMLNRHEMSELLLRYGCQEDCQSVPAQPRCFMQVGSASSLVIWFGDNALSPTATKYKGAYERQWSTDPEFRDIQTMIIVDLQQPCATIPNLCPNMNYYVRAYAGNFKGFSEAAVANPLCLTPSCWRDLSPQFFPRAANLETTNVLMDRVKKLEKDDFSYSSIQAEGASEKRRKLSLKNLLLTDNRLHKGNKSGLYLAAVMYRGNKVLHTFEDQIPVVLIDSSGPTTIASQFQWFLKLCCAKSLPSVCCTGDAVSHCSLLTYRVKLIQAMRTLQEILGQDDLGIAHVRPIVDRNENAVFVTVKNVESSRSIPVYSPRLLLTLNQGRSVVGFSVQVVLNRKTKETGRVNGQQRRDS
ncbi:hypothetical protein TTRE_0000373401 [Trichuris trichiura]|uniref:Fibronectin type-III domain-containing protein n=1 Tax=Trichuris trichiura TaxID=36087 RepID=A0A077Z4P5_TRITR|nr:hypothetical protein TTRE_0000373401 [Trichuris trichiura]